MRSRIFEDFLRAGQIGLADNAGMTPLTALERLDGELPMDGIDDAEVAETIDRQALVEAGKANVQITKIVDLQHSAAQRMIEEGTITEDQAETVEGDLASLQEDRMTEVHQDGSVRVTHEPENVLGHFDGSDPFLDAEKGIKEETYLHEADHREKGFVPGIGLDDPLAGGVEQELPEDIAKEVSPDDELVTLVQRDPLERSATEAGGETPQAYQVEHVDPTNRVIERMNAAGLDGKGVIDKVIVQHDVEAYRNAVKKTLVHEALAA